MYSWGGRTLVHAFGGQRTTCKNWFSPSPCESQELNKSGQDRWQACSPTEPSQCPCPQFLAYCLAYSKCPPPVFWKSSNFSISSLEKESVFYSRLLMCYWTSHSHSGTCLCLCKIVITPHPSAFPRAQTRGGRVLEGSVSK